MRLIIILILLVLAGCSSQTTPKGLIELTLDHWIDSLSKQKEIKLKKTIYLGTASEEKVIQPVNWEQEFALFRKYNISRIIKKGDLVVDTILDQRTHRYLVRGMRLASGTGAQSLYLVLDSNRKMLQFRVAEKEASWLKNIEREVFWDAQGEYNYSEKSEYTLASDEEIKIFGVWKKD